MRTLLLIITIICLILVTFFGLGPVLLADGGITERLITLGFVVILYVLLIGLLRTLLRNGKMK
jgi:hypothetical protein